MKAHQKLVLLGGVVLALLDFAVFAAMIRWCDEADSPGILGGLLLHALLLGIGLVLLRRLTRLSTRTGFEGFAELVGLICLLTPGFGFLAATFLVFWESQSAERVEREVGEFVYGNPRRKTRFSSQISKPAFDSSISHFDDGDSARWLQIAANLRHSHTAESVALLRQMMRLPNARVQLFAQTALGSMKESAENLITRLRKERDCPNAMVRLASTLFYLAKEGLGSEFELKEWLAEAESLYGKSADGHSADISVLVGWSRSLIALNRLPEAAEVIAQLDALALDEGMMHVLRAEYIAAAGNWEDLRRLMLQKPPEACEIAPSNYEFWIAEPPIAQFS